MKIPKYWARATQSGRRSDGKLASFTCWHWSDESLDHARQKASSRANDLVQRLVNEVQLDRYAYGDRPLREEILQGVNNQAGQEIAVVTRNAYGAQVLNAARAMFIDIDFSGKGGGSSLVGQLRGLFGGKPAPSQEEQYTQRVADWAAQRSDLGIRVYRTLAGLRCLITNRPFEPAQTEALNILRELNSDPLYIRLCQAQECFRARLTPKPWRCKLPMPPARYPWESAEAESRFRQWQQRYEQTASQYVACHFVTHIGPNIVHSEVEPVMKLHDQIACSRPDLNLA